MTLSLKISQLSYFVSQIFNKNIDWTHTANLKLKIAEPREELINFLNVS